jgi:putative DNA primase/helicase
MSGSLTERARGRWRHMLPMLGVDSRHLNGKHGACPFCGGKDRFRFDDKQGAGTWICSQCGAGDGFGLLMRLKGWDFKAAADRVEEIVGKAPVDLKKGDSRSDQQLREANNRLWTSGKPVRYGDTVSRYLEKRGIALEAFPSSLRYVDRCRYQTDGEPAYYPAMVAKITGPDGAPVTLHRTYLSDLGEKAPVAAPRRLMPSKLVSGCAVRLSPPGPVMGIAEGIETALSAGILHGVRTWAAINSAMLMRWEPPAGTQAVIVYGDNDALFGGQSAAYALAHRLSVNGLVVSVEVPPSTGADWNDCLQRVAREEKKVA